MSSASGSEEVRNIRVLHFVNSLRIGGAERQLLIIADGLVAAGVGQRIVQWVNSGVQYDNVAPGVKHSQGRGWLRGFWAGVREITSPGCTPIIVGWMYHGWLAGLAAWGATALVGRPAKVFFYCRHGDPQSLKMATYILCVTLLRIAAFLGIPVVFNSEASRAKHSRLAKLRRSAVIPNALYGRSVISSQNNRTIGYLGRNHPDKGGDRLPRIIAQALARTPGWSAHVAGPGISSLRTDINDELRAAGVDIRRVVVSDAVADVDSFYRSLGVLVLPSRVESFPNVLGEAMTYGIPVAALATGEVEAMLKDLIPVSSDPEELVELLVAICFMPDPAKIELGERLRGRAAELFGASCIVDRHLDLFVGED